ncbi:MAG: hypothetical protein FJ276_32330 [Planctomycetes bacterium]|nr:hypothetical protein [Planctomycetota bacterium]
MKYTLKKPDGTEVTLTRDQLTIGYNTREINTAWPAKEQSGTEWLRVGVLLGVEAPGLEPGFHSEPPPSENSTDRSLTAAPGADFAASLARRYADAYTEAHAVVTVGKIVKGVAVVLFILILIAGFVMASDSGNRQFGGGGTNGLVAGMGFALACIIGIPTYVLGILIAAQGQTSLASLDTAVNSSRHLSNEDVARVLAKRFSL